MGSCFALVAQMDNVTVCADGDKYCSPMKKARGSNGDAMKQRREDQYDNTHRCIMCCVHKLHAPRPAWGHVQRCFELAAHMDGVTVFSDRQQRSKVRAPKKRCWEVCQKRVKQPHGIVHREEG